MPKPDRPPASLATPLRPEAGISWNGTPAKCALIFCLTLIAYAPALSGSFLWNDSDYVTKPELQSLRGLGRIWFEVGATQQYYPFLHSIFWVEHALWGDASLGYHLANILLHATSACLFGLILRRLHVPGAFFAAVIFALHPVCVESVAWISEQKNTLSTVFYLLAALAYLKWTETETEVGTGLSRRSLAKADGLPVRSELEGHPEEADGQAARPYLRGWTLYALATLLFILALMSKSVTATLPAALLVVLWWKRGRLSWRRDVRPLLPWFALGAATGLFTGWVERRFIGAQGPDFALSLVQRFLVAGRAVWFYLGKLLWPVQLIFIYPRWNVNPAIGWQYLFPLGVLGLLAILWARRRQSRGPLAALLLFGGSLFPILGFFNVYAFIFSFVADHFQYLASLSIIALVAAGWGLIGGGPPASRLPPALKLWRPSKAITAITVIALLGVLTWRQCRMYRDGLTFYQTILEENPGAWMAHNNLGLALAAQGRRPEAITHYEQALQLRPNDAETQNNLGIALAAESRWAEAMAHLEQARQIEPGDPVVYYNMGFALAGAGRTTEAIAQYEQALRLKPGYVDAHTNLGSLLYQSGRVPEAIVQYEQALRLKPDLFQTQSNLGLALATAGRVSEAVAHFERASRLRPSDPLSHYNWGIALAQLGRFAEARRQFEAVLQLKPDDAAARATLARLNRYPGQP